MAHPNSNNATDRYSEDPIKASLDRSAEHMQELRKEYGAEPGQTLQGAIIARRKEGWDKVQGEFCDEVANDIKHGILPNAAYDAMLQRAGFAEGTRLACAPHNEEHPNHGVTVDNSVPAQSKAFSK